MRSNTTDAINATIVALQYDVYCVQPSVSIDTALMRKHYYHVSQVDQKNSYEANYYKVTRI